MERLRVNNVRQISINIDSDEIPDPDFEADECGSGLVTFRFLLTTEMVKIGEVNSEHEIVKYIFLLSLRSLAKETRIVAIHKNKFSTLTGSAWLGSHKMFKDALLKKRGGDANARFAWYCAARDEVRVILCHGFSTRVGKIAGNGVMEGVGVHFNH